MNKNPYLLPLLPLSLLSMAMPTMAANFSLSQANLDKVQLHKYACQRCGNQAKLQGEVAVSGHYIEGNDYHAANAFGTSDDGALISASGELAYQQAQGYYLTGAAHDVGLSNSDFVLSGGKHNVFDVTLAYDQLTTWDSNSGRSQYQYDNGELVHVNQPNYFPVKLFKQRETLGAELSYYLNDATLFAGFDSEHITGNRHASMMKKGPMSFALPLDARVHDFSTGMSVAKGGSQAQLVYQLSQYRNDIQHIDFPQLPYAYGAEVDNERHQLQASGMHNFGRTVINGQLTVGRLTQDDVSLHTNQLSHWQGEVETLDVTSNLTSLLTSNWRVLGKVAYSQRDNTATPVPELGFRLDDLQRLKWDITSRYQLRRGQKLELGYQHRSLDRDYGPSEQTENHEFWGKYQVNNLAGVRMSLKYAHDEQVAEHFDNGYLVMDDEHVLLRKFHLADRDRDEVELRLSYAPASWALLSLTSGYRHDDYGNTSLGLTGSELLRYDALASFVVGQHGSAYAQLGQQWINTVQQGQYRHNNHSTRIEDSFTSYSLGGNYSGLMDERLTLGVEYVYSDADSNVLVVSDVAYGDYDSANHSVMLHANYQYSHRLGLGVSYQYERYRDSDVANVISRNVPNLVTLGDLSHNYHAHEVVLTVSYRI